MKLRMGMIGGGEGSFIGPVHRIASRLDGMIELKAGAFSSKAAKSASTGRKLGLQPGRVYGNWKEMITRESAMPDNEKLHIISVVTPNHLHYEQALAAVKAGFNVICDKPLCISVSEAISLRDTIREKGTKFCITHNYSGYPMVKKARELVDDGKIGEVRKIVCEYLQGWLTDSEEKMGNSQAEWRADPSKAGLAGCMADIGTHAFQLSEYISGRKVNTLFSRLNTFVEGRLLDDDGTVLTQMEGGIEGSIIASQVACGEENGLTIRVYGSKGSLKWEQMEPNTLLVRHKDGPAELHRTAASYINKTSSSFVHSRLPAGHPEGFIEAFANLYRNFAMDINAQLSGTEPDPLFDYPGIDDGVRGMKFLDAVVKSSGKSEWVDLS